jgi:hypothetical protein
MIDNEIESVNSFRANETVSEYRYMLLCLYNLMEITKKGKTEFGEVEVRNLLRKGSDISKKYVTYALIDGLNIAFSRNDGMARLEDSLNLLNLLKSSFDHVELFFDASARYKIDNKTYYSELVKSGAIIQSPAATQADDLIWMRAVSLAEKGIIPTILTNDTFPLERNRKARNKINNTSVTILQNGEIYCIPRDMNRKGYNEGKC